ncbi:hypothetical protein FIBSPDRAFT_240843 [Athelia psychrophila]|uniref:Uncharacterized protein n=1 Tax=Athelia psychrophila TaxID=1759441 RepID=A0A165Y9Y0_9AGAM|nr:hypothetical protein FIBSPDRAFT_240843 [Fibularhizoctonia sp. CBS 109695]
MMILIQQSTITYTTVACPQVINISKYIKSTKSDHPSSNPPLTMSAFMETLSPTVTHAHTTHSPSAATVEPAVVADTDAPTLPGPIDDINVSSRNDSDQVKAYRRQKKDASRRCKWVSKAAAGMDTAIQLTHAETSLVVAWYWRVVVVEKGFPPQQQLVSR